MLPSPDPNHRGHVKPRSSHGCALCLLPRLGIRWTWRTRRSRISSRLNCCASVASPSMIGVMGVSLTPVSKPSFFISALKYLALSQSLSTNAVELFQQINGRQTCRGIRRSDRRREQEWSSTLTQPFDDDFVCQPRVRPPHRTPSTLCRLRYPLCHAS